jgi:hypothetical protein
VTNYCPDYARRAEAWCFGVDARIFMMRCFSLLTLAAVAALSAPAFAGTVQHSDRPLPRHVAPSTLATTPDVARVWPVLEYELLRDDSTTSTPDAARILPVLEYELMRDDATSALPDRIILTDYSIFSGYSYDYM